MPIIPIEIKRTMTFQLPKHLFDELTEYCKKTNQKKAKIIREAISEYLNKQFEIKFKEENKNVVN